MIPCIIRAIDAKGRPGVPGPPPKALKYPNFKSVGRTWVVWDAATMSELEKNGVILCLECNCVPVKFEVRNATVKDRQTERGHVAFVDAVPGFNKSHWIDADKAEKQIKLIDDAIWAAFQQPAA